MSVGKIEYAPNFGKALRRVDAAFDGACHDSVARLAVEGDNDNVPKVTAGASAKDTLARFPKIMARLAEGPRPSGFYYLGSPYSLYKDGHDAAASMVARAAAGLMADGLVVYSPIAHGHFVTMHGDLPQDWEFWKEQCQPMIDAAAALIVLRMEGWQESVGLTYEIGEFDRAGKPVHYMSLETALGRESRRAA